MNRQAVDYLLALASSFEAGNETARALSVLDLAASTDTGAADALELKGDLLRSRGELRQAADVFDLLGRRHPDHPRARYLSALLSGANPPLPRVRPAPWPSPFVRLEDFLSRARHAELLELVTSETSAFEPSTVGTVGATGRVPRVVPDSRTSSRLKGIAAVAVWLRPLIAECIGPISAHLGIAPFAVAEIELKCSVYGDGIHSDNLYQRLRQITFVYYFHQLPKRYSGGALLLYDGDVGDRTRYFRDHVTRLDPLDNSLVFFPSSTFHEVSPVVSPSGRLEDGRFTFAGHVNIAAGDAPVPGTPAQDL